jgi:hypothetical protein
LNGPLNEIAYLGRLSGVFSFRRPPLTTNCTSLVVRHQQAQRLFLEVLPGTLYFHRHNLYYNSRSRYLIHLCWTAIRTVSYTVRHCAASTQVERRNSLDRASPRSGSGERCWHCFIYSTFSPVTALQPALDELHLAVADPTHARFGSRDAASNRIFFANAQ